MKGSRVYTRFLQLFVVVMTIDRKIPQKTSPQFLALLFLLALSPLFVLFAIKLVNSLEYQNSDFFTFWLAGWMRWVGQDPYST